MRVLHFTLIVFALAAVLVASSCAAPRATSDAPVGAEPHGATDTAREPLPAALQMLPQDSVLLLYTPSLEAFAERLAAPSLGDAFDATVGAITHDLIDVLAGSVAQPAELARHGIDTSQPAGFAWVDPDSLTSVLFATVADDAALQALLDDVVARAGHTLESTRHGGARIDYVHGAVGTSGYQHVWLVRREGQAFVVLSPHGREVGDAAARRIAEVAPGDSLALRGAATLHAAPETGLLRGGLWSHVWPERSRERARTALQEQRAFVNEVRRSLDKARRDPAKTATLRELLRSSEVLEAQMQAAYEFEQRLVTEFWHPLAQATLALDMTQAHGWFEARAEVAAGTLVRKLLVARGEGLERFARALAPEQAALGYLSLDLPQLLELEATLFELGLHSPLLVPRAVFPMLTGQALIPVLELLDGELAVAVSRPASRPQLAGAHAWAAEVDVSVVLGVREPAAVTAWLDGLRADPLVALVLRKRADDHYVLNPLAWKTVQLVMIENRIVLSSDPDFVARYRDGHDGGLLDSLPSDVRDALSATDTVAWLSFDPALAAEASFAMRPPPPPPRPPPGIDPQDTARAALLTEYERLLAERQQTAETRRQRLFELTRGNVLGTFTAHARLQPEHLTVRLEQLGDAPDNEQFFAALASTLRGLDALSDALHADREAWETAVDRLGALWQ